MVNTKSQLEQEEMEALKALEELTGQATEEATEPKAVTEEVTPEQQPSEAQTEQPTPTPTEPPKSIDFSKYEEDFNQLGIKLDDDKKADPQYLMNRFLTVAGMTKKQAQDYKNLKSQLEEKNNEIAKIREEYEIAKSKKSEKVVEEVDRDEDFEAFEAEIKDKFEVDDGYMSALKGLYNNGRKKQANIEKQLQALQDRLNKINEQESDSNFWYGVFSDVPEAREILSNDNYAFSAWLEQPLYGAGSVTKGETYDIAKNRSDTTTVARLIKQYISETKGKKTNDIPDAIRNQVTPNSVSSGESQEPMDKKIFTREEVEKVWDNIIHRKYSKEEAEKWEAELELATMEGRIK